MADEMSMRERLAKTLWAHKANAPAESWTWVSLLVKREFLADVDAILAELRTPTEAMLDAGDWEIDVWQAMLDKANE